MQEHVRSMIDGSVVAVEDTFTGSHGTGFIMSGKSGKSYIITNAHVCEGLDGGNISVVYRDAEIINEKTNDLVKIVKVDGKHDLCALSIPNELIDHPSLTLADSVRLDEQVFNIGFPSETLMSVASGHVRGIINMDQPYDIPLNKCVGAKFSVQTVPISTEELMYLQNNMKHLDLSSQEPMYDDVTLIKLCFLHVKLYFTDSIADYGSSGSPMVNSDGEVIGVVMAIKGKARPFALVIPLAYLVDFLNRL